MNSKLLMVVATAALCAAQPVSAADLPARAPTYNAPAVVPVPIFSWTGCYVGLNAGGGFGKSDYTTNVDFPLGGAGFDAGIA